MNGAVLRMIAHSPPLLPSAFPCFNYHVVWLFRVVQSMLIVVVCHLFPIRERNECKIDECESNQKYKRTCSLPFCVRLRFVPTVSDLLVNLDASCDLLCAHLHLPVRCLLLPFPPHIIPLLLIFAPWRKKKVRYENKYNLHSCRLYCHRKFFMCCHSA
jgi:hypothetical protein